MTNKSTNFYPIESKTITFTASAASANVQFTTAFPNSDPAIYPSSLEIANRTTVDVFVAWGTSSAVAATVAGSYQVGPGVDKIIEIGGPNTWVAVIPLSVVTGNVYLTKGRGA